jgi:hypothetical protein
LYIVCGTHPEQRDAAKAVREHFPLWEDIAKDFLDFGGVQKHSL